MKLRFGSKPPTFQVADSSAPDGIQLKAQHYSDREPWECLRDYRDSDYDLHWESRRTTAPHAGDKGGDTETLAFCGLTPLLRCLVNPVVLHLSPPGLSLGGLEVSFVSYPCWESGLAFLNLVVYSPHLAPTGPTCAPAIKTQVVRAASHSKDCEESRVQMVVRRDQGADVAADAVSDAGSSVATSSTVTAIPDERAVWISQRLRIRSTQNLVDVDLEADGTPQSSGGGAGFGSPVAGAGSAQLVQPAETDGKTSETEGNKSETRQRHKTRSVRDASSSGPSAARHGPKKKRHGQTSLIRTGAQAAPGPRRTKSKVRMKAFDIRVEEYKEESRHVSQGDVLPRAPRVVNS